MATWSPEQIANTETLGIVSFKTIYNWIYAGKLCGVDTKHLRQKGKRRNVEKRGRFTIGTPISERLEEVKHRQIFGHWELDTMVSSRGGSNGFFATFVKYKRRLYTALKIGDRSAASMLAAISQLYHTLSTAPSRLAQLIVARSSRAIATCGKNSIYRSISRTPILPDKGLAMKTPMAY